MIEPGIDIAQIIDETSMLTACFDVKKIEHFELLTGTFSRSNYCNIGSDSIFPLVSSSPRVAFDAQSCSGQHLWIDAQHNKIERYLSHYVKGKMKIPTMTSVVIIVPR